jgi:hypothetical protein
MTDSPKEEPKHKEPRNCDVPTCGKPIGEFGHVCNYPGKPKPGE